MTSTDLNAFLPTFTFRTIGLTLVTAIGFWDGKEYYQWHSKGDEGDLTWKFLEFLSDRYGETEYFKKGGVKIYGHRAANLENRLIFHELEKRDEAMSFLPTYQSLTWTKANIRFDDSSLHIKKPFKYLKDRDLKELVLMDFYEEEESSVLLDLKAEVINLSRAMTQWYKDWWASFGVEPSTTYMTTTLAAVRKNFCTSDFDLSKNATKFNLNRGTETFVRKAIYGMRNEVYCRLAEEGHYMHGDIHSFFPSCYDTDIPVGELDWAKADLDDPLAAVVEVDVYVPEDLYIGPLPYHDAERGLIFPTGHIPKTWYDVKELRNAVQKYGAVVKKIHRQLNCERWSRMLHEFGQAIDENTLFPKSNKKLIAIGPSGKMGQHRWRTEVKHWRNMKDSDFKSFVPIGENESYLEIMTFNKSPYIMPAVTMRVRAEGRVRHLDRLYEAYKNGKVFYCDSDSIFCTYGAVPTIAAEDAAMGDLILIDEFTHGYFIRQKLYGVLRADGTMLQRSAGYSDLKFHEGDFQNLLKDETVLDLKVESLSNLRQRLTKQELEVFERHMQVTGSSPASRVSMGNDTKPIYLEETK